MENKLINAFFDKKNYDDKFLETNLQFINLHWIKPDCELWNSSIGLDRINLH